jgi:hypothetical protein
MLEAARGPLADSILLYATWANALWVLATLATAALLPVVLRRPCRLTAVIAAVLILTGPLAATRVDTAGLERNAIATLMSSALPRVASKPATGDWRASNFAGSGGEDPF